jgi:hypothetical protein
MAARRYGLGMCTWDVGEVDGDEYVILLKNAADALSKMTAILQ